MTTVSLAVYAYLGSWTNITSDVFTSVSADWGMKSNSPTDVLAQTGTLRFSLKNNTGKYTPGGAAVVHADWGKGTPIKTVFTYNSQSYIRFYGRVDAIRLDAGTSGQRKAHCTVLDWMNYAAKYPLNNPAIEANKRVDEAIETILEGMPIQPQVTDIDTGALTLPYIFFDATLKTKAYSEFHKLAMSELGSYIYVKKDKDYGETLRFENATRRGNLYTPVKHVIVTYTGGNLLQENGDALLQENGDNILTESFNLQAVEVDNTMTGMSVVYGENLINRISVSVNPTRVDSVDTQIFSLDSPLFVNASNEKSFFVEFTEADSKRIVAALPPEASYPTTLFHFDAPGVEELVIDEGGKPWDDYSLELVTNIKKIGVSSLYFDGSGSYAEGSSSEDYNFGNGDFTVEWWEYRFNADANEAIISRDGTGGYCPFVFGMSNGTGSYVYITSNGSSWDIANAKFMGTIATTTWTHYAITRKGNTFRTFQNGILMSTWTSSATILTSSSPMVIGKSGSNYITACLDEMRIVKGHAAYTANFSPPTTPFALSGLIYAAWTNANGTGSELTPDFDISINYGAAGGDVTVTNSGTTGGYLTTLKLFGKIVESVSAVTDIQEDADSIEAYGYQDLSINQPYQADFTSGREVAAGILQLNKVPLVGINKVTMNANRDNAHMAYFLQTDIGDVVRIIEDQTETNGSYFINGMGWNATAGATGATVNYWWVLKKFERRFEPLAVRFADLVTNYNHVEFGYLPQVAIENVPYRIWSLWFNATTLAQSGVLIGCLDNSTGDIRGYSFYISGTSRRLAFSGVSNNYWQAWRTATSAIPNTPDTWIHVMAAYDSRSISNAPNLYINGSLVSSSSYASSATASSSEVGTNLKINRSTSDLLQQTSIKDARIYNGDFVSNPAALAAALYAEGAYGDDNQTGLVFRAFYVLDTELADYEGAYLTESMKIVDDIGLAIGTPKNSPLGEAL